MTNLIPAEFHGLSVEILDHAGKKWLTAEQIGRALGYDESNARKGVLKLYERHGDEFTEADTFVVTLTTNSRGNPTTRIFSDTGCIKLGFFANTARAKDFRTWAAKVLAGHPAVVPAPTSVESRLDRLEATTATLAGHMAQLVEVSYQQAKKLDVTARYIGLLEINQKGKVRITRTVEAQVLALKAQGMPQADIARLLRISQATVSLLVHGKFTWSADQAALPPESVESILERIIEKERASVAESLEGGAQ